MIRLCHQYVVLCDAEVTEPLLEGKRAVEDRIVLQEHNTTPHHQLELKRLLLQYQRDANDGRQCWHNAERKHDTLSGRAMASVDEG